MQQQIAGRVVNSRKQEPVPVRIGFPSRPFFAYGPAVAAEPIVIRNTWNAVRDHARRYQDFTYVYPVISRRSRGLSVASLVYIATMSETWRKLVRSTPISTNAACMPGSTRITQPA
jgi:hypothetical protein